MTREELERRIACMMAGAYDRYDDALEAAQEAVRLVVEACCEEADQWALRSYTNVSDRLRSTFLPPEANDGEAV